MIAASTKTLLFTVIISFSTVVSANENTGILEDQKIAISSPGHLLAVSWENSISIFNLENGSKLQEFDAETDTPFVFKFSQDSAKIYASGWEKTTIWDVKTGNRSAQIETHGNTECGGFSSDQKNSYFDDEYNQFGQKKLIISNHNLSKEKLIIKNSARCNSSSDNKYVAIQVFNMAADGLSLKSTEIKIIDLNKATVQNTLSGEKANAYDEDMFFFDDNRKLLVRDFSNFHIWDLEKNIVTKSWDSELDVDEISISGNLVLLTADEQIRFWNLMDNPGPIEAITLPEKHNKIIDASLSNEGKYYAITSYGENEQEFITAMFETGTNKLVHQTKISTPTYGAQFTKDDTLLILESYPIKVVDVATGDVVHEIQK